jgi:hypothetical protein
MNKAPFHLSNLIPFLPYLYYIALSVAMFFVQTDKETASIGDLKMLILAVPFAVQLIFSFRHVDLILGVIMFVLALYLTLAYASDLAKLTAYTTRAVNFIVIGGLVVILNYVMAILLFRNERLRHEPIEAQPC